MRNKKRLFNNLKNYFEANLKSSYLSEKNVIVITNDDKVYEFSRNTHNIRSLLLAVSSNQLFIESLIKKSIVEELCGKQIIGFRNGEFHKIALTIDGKIYCWGRGVLGNGLKNNFDNKPELNSYLKDKQIIDVKCGYEHTLVLTNNNEVFGWGRNDLGQVGNGSFDDVLVPIQVNKFLDEKVKGISCGRNHSMMLTESGHVYSWGNNLYGQLGIKIRVKSSNIPKQIKLRGVEIVKISCGSNHSLLLSSDGHIYALAKEDTGYLDTGGLDYVKHKRKILNTLRQIYVYKLSGTYNDIESYLSCCIASISTQTGDKYQAWGRNKFCGFDSFEKEFKSFDEVFENLFQITYDKKNDRLIEFDYKLTRNRWYRTQIFNWKKLGEGSYGEVFKTRKMGGFKWFAVKKVNLTIIEEKDLMRELENSLIIMRLRGNRLVEYTGRTFVEYQNVWIEKNFDSNNGSNEKVCDEFTLYIEVELCDKSLDELMGEVIGDSNIVSNGCLTFLGYFIASQIFVEILEGVNFLHKQIPPIIHRDLKPDNILLKIGSNNQFVKIADLGLARIHQSRDQLHSAERGQLKCMSPEVDRGEHYDTRADIYSLGVILGNLFLIDSDK
jgi:alpha-tubulin suppressor-like RCC1 family protein